MTTLRGFVSSTPTEVKAGSLKWDMLSPPRPPHHPSDLYAAATAGGKRLAVARVGPACSTEPPPGKVTQCSADAPTSAALVHPVVICFDPEVLVGDLRPHQFLLHPVPPTSTLAGAIIPAPSAYENPTRRLRKKNDTRGKTPLSMPLRAAFTALFLAPLTSVFSLMPSCRGAPSLQSRPASFSKKMITWLCCRR